MQIGKKEGKHDHGQIFIDRWLPQDQVVKTVKGAQKYAHERVGAHPEIGGWYAVSGDGVGKVQVVGIDINEVFPPRVD